MTGKIENSRSAIEFYLTPEHTCPYLDNKQSKTLFLTPQNQPSRQIYQQLIQQGFRRSGDHIYRPQCEDCRACISVRLLTKELKLSKQQKRCLRKATGFSTEIHTAQFDLTHYRMFEQYINIRHSDGDMYPTSQTQYREFLLSKWMDSYFFDIYDEAHKLIACSVFDQLDTGLSAIYTFFDPEYSSYSLGRLAILALAEQCVSRDLPYLYLGYWIKDCQKMAYKGDYRPLECFVNGRWTRLN